MHNANEKQVGGTHYGTEAVQHWDYVTGALKGRYLEGNITKYVARHRKKNGVQDLEKALHYLDKLEELHAAGKYIAMVAALWVGKMPSIVSQFIGEMTYWEGRVMVDAASWRDAADLRAIRSYINYLHAAVLRAEVEASESFAAEATSSYVNQDQTSNHLDGQSLRSRAVTIAKKHGSRSGHVYADGDFVPHEWVVQSVVEALGFNLNGR